MTRGKWLEHQARQLLASAAYTREELDRWLDPDYPKWAKFDAELGYVLHTSVIRDGVDGASCVYGIEPTGERQRINYSDCPCRVNTYGNSFTHCAQVSDGETWQEYLAAHLREPVRNFGVGGYGVYQAYLRMLREEAIKTVSAEYVIFNVYFDDHFRSLDSWRWLRLPSFRDLSRRVPPGEPSLLCANPWPHVRLDETTGDLLEYANPYSTPDSLYDLCDADHAYERFKDDFIVQLLV